MLEAGLPFEVVPGVTSGVAAPAYAGIPVTHRQVSTSVAFVTGHEDPTKGRIGRRLGETRQRRGYARAVHGRRPAGGDLLRLISAGRDPETPVACVRWGTLPEQSTVTGTLEDIADQGSGS